MTQPESALPRRGVNEKDVWQAADALLLEGRRPTIESVRLHIGRGSPNTITPYLDTWFKGLGRRLQDPSGYQPASAVPEPIAAAAVHFWESAMAAARGTLEGERRELEDARQALAQEREVLSRETERVQATERALQEALHLAKEQLAHAIARGDRLVARNDMLETELTELKAYGKELVLTLQAERATREAEGKAALDAQRAESERHEAARLRWMQETDAARTAEKTALAQVERLRKELAKARGDLEQERIRHADELAGQRGLLAESKALAETTVLELERVKEAHGAALSSLREARERHERELDQQREHFAETLRSLGRHLVAPQLVASAGAASR